MKKNPVLVWAGLAVAAVALVLGLTKDKWMGTPPQDVSSLQTAVAPGQKASEPETAPEPATAPTEQAAAPMDETPAPAEASAPAADDAAATTEQPAAPASEEQGQTKSASEPSTPAAPEGEQEAASAAPQAAPEQQQAAVADSAAPSAEQVEAPTFDTVRVEKSGEAVIAGTAEAGSDVVVKLNGQEIGKTKANSDGAFVLVPDEPLPEGSGALTIEAKGEGESEPTASEQVVAVIVPAKDKPKDVLVAVVSPDAPTKVLQAPEAVAKPDEPAPQDLASVESDTAIAEGQTAAQSKAGAVLRVSVDAVDYDGAGNIVFSGRGQPGHGARIYVDNGHLGDAPVGGDGRWVFSGTTAIGIGVHQLRVDGIDASGKVLNRVEVPFFREQGDKVATAADPAVNDAAKTDSEQSVAITAAGETDIAASGATLAEGGTESDAAAKPKLGRVVIQPGNNLWRISEVLYGSGTKFTLLYEANKDQIRDPDMIYPGQIFATPNVVPPAETIDPKQRKANAPEAGTASGQ